MIHAFLISKLSIRLYGDITATDLSTKDKSCISGDVLFEEPLLASSRPRT